MRLSQKSIVYDVMEQALEDSGYNASDAMVVTVRDVFYSVRELYFEHPDFPVVRAKMEAAWAKKGNRKKHGAASIDFDWFRDILTAWQREHRRLDRLIWDVRGHLYEPHTGDTHEIGSLSMADYEFPELYFDKLLYIEKEGEMGKVREARLAERYDMAILTGKGMPTEEIRLLLERAEGEDFQLFCFHDADPDGYEIARVLGEETDRMPGYSVEVIDLGLTYPDALAMGLRGEPFTRQKHLNQTLIGYLMELEPATWGATLAAMTGEQISEKSWSAWRYELNTIKPVAARMGYIARKLDELGVRPKVIPDADYLEDHVADATDLDLRAEVDLALTHIARAAGVYEKAAEEFSDRYEEIADNAERAIRDGFDADPYGHWRGVIRDAVDGVGRGYRDELRRKAREWLAATDLDESEDA